MKKIASRTPALLVPRQENDLEADLESVSLLREARANFHHFFFDNTLITLKKIKIVGPH